MRRFLTLTAVVVSGIVSAQQPAFDVASVKADRSGAPNVGAAGDRFANGQFQTTNIPLRLLMRQVFERFQDLDLAGGPGWLDTDRWDIKAKTESRSEEHTSELQSPDHL